MTTRPFGETLAAAKQGDEQAFAALFQLVQAAVLRYLVVVAPYRAEDLAAETWLHVVRGLDTFDATEPAAFRAWVLSIARHRWLDDLRAHDRRPEVLAGEMPEPAADVDVSEIVDGIVSTQSALALIGRLPRDQAEVVALRYIGDLDVTATASMVGKLPGSVRVLCHRGLRRLEELLRADAAAESA